MHIAYLRCSRLWRDSLHGIFKWRQRGQLITQKRKITSANVTFLCLSSQTRCQTARPSPQGCSHGVRKIHQKKIKRVVPSNSGYVCDICTQNYSLSVCSSFLTHQAAMESDCRKECHYDKIQSDLLKI